VLGVGTAPIVVRATPAVTETVEVPVIPAMRKVVVPLPFVATRVMLDDQASEVVPASDVAAFELPGDSGLRHRLTVTALDGTRAEGYVREEDGIARPEGDGLMFVSDPVPADAHPAVGRPPRPIGTVHNGFTKLR